MIANTSAFVQRFIVGQRPVVIRGARETDKLLQWYSKEWAKAPFLSKYGDAQVNIADIPYGDQFTGEKLDKVSLRDFVEQISTSSGRGADTKSIKYVFINAREMLSQVQETIEGLPSPGWMSPPQTADDGRTKRRLQFVPFLTEFYLGAAGSGAPFHSHNAAWNYLAYGKKKWALITPDEALWSVKSAWSFFMEDMARMSKDLQTQTPPLTCTQHSGDLIVLPPRWGHTTLNLRNSIGIAREFNFNLDSAAAEKE